MIVTGKTHRISIEYFSLWDEKLASSLTQQDGRNRATIAKIKTISSVARNCSA
jgi:hypothetical protein